MAKNYIVTLIVLLFFAFAPKAFAQEIAQPKIENLSIYPNPVNSNRQFIFITSKHNLVKQIEFFNAIGKKIYATTLTGKELNISRLATGVYFLKITENNITETRKLVIK
ncbi:T9SS type A sorting domain-containing protein [Aestuariivivens sediminicola]|uniref:T9SS type A sorting domain-containing protein n=1 Tax=Aestuariivivens sediminicola TaxID=2913560 RepID=UPI001F5A0A67|nr:T9SS type A sorting domain-containing protein [Aestuariivivens sediminicola]